MFYTLILRKQIRKPENGGKIQDSDVLWPDFLNISVTLCMTIAQQKEEEQRKWKLEIAPNAQWSEGVTKTSKQYSKIDTSWDFLSTFGCIMIK